MRIKLYTSTDRSCETHLTMNCLFFLTISKWTSAEKITNYSKYSFFLIFSRFSHCPSDRTFITRNRRGTLSMRLLLHCIYKTISPSPDFFAMVANSSRGLRPFCSSPSLRCGRLLPVRLRSPQTAAKDLWRSDAGRTAPGRIQI